MKRLFPLVLILSVLAGPSLAGGFGVDLPVLTWPDETPQGGASASTKGVRP